MAYVWALDLVRFAAASMVVIFHLTWHRPTTEFTLNTGWVGVEIFFVISGFVIVGTAQRANLGAFVEKRIARLYPAAICCALLGSAVLWIGQSAANSVGVEAHLSVANALRSMLLVKGPFLVSALWTLPIELMFYALIGMVLVAKLIDRIDSLAAALTLWSALYLVPFALHIYGLTTLPVPSMGYDWRNLTLLRHGCFFGLGIMLWLAVHKPFKTWWSGIIVLAGALCCLEIVARAREILDQYAYPVLCTHLALTAALFFCLCVSVIWLSARFNADISLNSRTQHVMRMLGLMTYPLYLCHEAVAGTVLGLLDRLGAPQPLSMLAAVGAALVASYLVVIIGEPWMRTVLMTTIFKRTSGLRVAQPGSGIA